MDGKIEFGPNFSIRKELRWDYNSGQNIEVSIIDYMVMPALKMHTGSSNYFSHKITPDMLGAMNYQMPESYLACDSNGQFVWKNTLPNAFEMDEQLRADNPNLQHAFNNLLQALNEYAMVRKLIKDDPAK